MEDLFKSLQDQPEDVAFRAFQSIRQGVPLETILRSMGGDMSRHINPSLHAANRSFLPPTQTPIEYQLVVQNPAVYPSLIPLDAASVDMQLLDITPLGVDGLQNQRTGSFSSVDKLAADTKSTINPQTVMNKAPDNTRINLVDSRLMSVDFTQWTSVKIRHRHAAEAIMLFLELNQPWWAFFDTDLFLDDLSNGEHNFCSPLLVNALLAWATVSLPATYCSC